MLNLIAPGHRELERYYPLFETEFDSEELLSRLAIHKGMRRRAAWTRAARLR